MSIVFPEKRDSFSIEVEQPLIGDRDPMGVAPEIPNHLHGTTEGQPDIDHPVVAVQPAEELGKLLGITKSSQGPVHRS